MKANETVKRGGNEGMKCEHVRSPARTSALQTIHSDTINLLVTMYSSTKG